GGRELLHEGGVALEGRAVESGELLSREGGALPDLRQEAPAAGCGEQCGGGFRADQPFRDGLREQGGGGRGPFAAEQREHREQQGLRQRAFCPLDRAFPLESARPLPFGRNRLRFAPADHFRFPFFARLTCDSQTAYESGRGGYSATRYHARVLIGARRRP